MSARGWSERESADRVGATSGVNQITTTTYNDFAHAERLAGDERIALDSYAVIASPTGKEYLQITPVIAGYRVMIWDKLTNPKSSTEVETTKPIAALGRC